MVHLPLIRRITSCSNCRFLGCDMLYAFPDFLADGPRATRWASLRGRWQACGYTAHPGDQGTLHMWRMCRKRRRTVVSTTWVGAGAPPCAPRRDCMSNWHNQGAWNSWQRTAGLGWSIRVPQIQRLWRLSAHSIRYWRSSHGSMSVNWIAFTSNSTIGLWRQYTLEDERLVHLQPSTIKRKEHDLPTKPPGNYVPHVTLRKTNIASEKWWLRDYFPLGW